MESGSDTAAVELTDVTVKYQVPSEPVATLKEQIIRRLQRRPVKFHEFWALHGFNLRVNKGEALGVVGRNGAGKSTLLKVVARVLLPTRGRVQLRGSVAPLIELGAGFHPELTGRENIYLNGAMLGFSRADMAQKLESIIEFAELPTFIDAPLRTYSSGMILRLGFAVASDVDPDILLIDEVLAVGDEAFQQKCLARMDHFRQIGTTILFVSHSLEAIRRLCDRVIWIDGGRIHASGDVGDITRAYAESVEGQSQPMQAAI